VGEEKRRKRAGTYPYKPDTGIARLPNGMPIREEMRDALNEKLLKNDGVLKHEPTTHDKQRSIYRSNDTRTTSELMACKFSGLRQNPISRQTEIWIGGEIRKRLHEVDLQRNPALMAQAFEELFPGWGHLIEVDGDAFYKPPVVYKDPHG